jgi:hypothetical protein
LPVSRVDSPCRSRAQNKARCRSTTTSCESTTLAFCNTSTHGSTTYRTYSFIPSKTKTPITGYRQDAESLNAQDARNVLVYNFGLKWGSNESIMGTRFQHRNCFLLIIHRSALFTHPLCKCISTLRVIPSRNYHDNIVWEALNGHLVCKEKPKELTS